MRRVEMVSDTQLRILLDEYRSMVKTLHENVIESRSIYDFDKARKTLEKLQKEKEERIYTRVLDRYPEYKEYDKRAVVLYGLLLENRGGKNN